MDNVEEPVHPLRAGVHAGVHAMHTGTSYHVIMEAGII